MSSHPNMGIDGRGQVVDGASGSESHVIRVFCCSGDTCTDMLATVNSTDPTYLDRAAHETCRIPGMSASQDVQSTYLPNPHMAIPMGFIPTSLPNSHNR